MRRPARACRRCRMSARSLADGDLVELHTWGCDPSLPPDPDPDVVVAALHLDGAALLEVDPDAIVGVDLDVDADLWNRNMVAIRRELFPGEAGFVPLADRTPPAFATPPPADWQPLSTSPLWDDLDLYRDDVVDPGERHARRTPLARRLRLALAVLFDREGKTR